MCCCCSWGGPVERRIRLTSQKAWKEPINDSSAPLYIQGVVAGGVARGPQLQQQHIRSADGRAAEILG